MIDRQPKRRKWLEPHVDSLSEAMREALLNLVVGPAPPEKRRIGTRKRLDAPTLEANNSPKSLRRLRACNTGQPPAEVVVVSTSLCPSAGQGELSSTNCRSSASGQAQQALILRTTTTTLRQTLKAQERGPLSSSLRLGRPDDLRRR